MVYSSCCSSVHPMDLRPQKVHDPADSSILDAVSGAVFFFHQFLLYFSIYVVILSLILIILPLHRNVCYVPIPLKEVHILLVGAGLGNRRAVVSVRPCGLDREFLLRNHARKDGGGDGAAEQRHRVHAIVVDAVEADHVVEAIRATEKCRENDELFFAP